MSIHERRNGQLPEKSDAGICEDAREHLLDDSPLSEESRKRLEEYVSGLLEQLERESGGDVAKMGAFLESRVDGIEDRMRSKEELGRSDFTDIVNAVKLFDKKYGCGDDFDRYLSYELRERLLHLSTLSGNPLSTSEVFTVAVEFSSDECVGPYGFAKPSFKSYQKRRLQESGSWIPDRSAFHDQTVSGQIDATANLSDRIVESERDNGSPYVGRSLVQYALRGNTASGKSTALRRDPVLAPALERNIARGDLPVWRNGVLNPDNFKAEILDYNVVDTNTQQVHVESCAMNAMLEQRIAALVSTGRISRLIHDKRLSSFDEVVDLGDGVVIRDMSVALKDSLLGVLGRGVDTYEPRVIPSAIIAGHREVLDDRLKVISYALEGKVLDYEMYSRRGSDVKRIAWIQDGVIKVDDKHKLEFLRSIGIDILDKRVKSRVPLESLSLEKIEDLARISGASRLESADEGVFDGEVFESVLARYDESRQGDPRDFLRPFVGRTIGEVVDAWQKRPIVRRQLGVLTK